MGIEPYYERDGIQIFVGDNREVLPHIEPVHAVVTDPPYGLTQAKRNVPAPTNDSPYNRHRVGVNGDVKPVGGFMGKQWDGTGIERDPELWQAIMAAMLPGAHLLAFGGDRTIHRIMTAIEDSGMEIRTQLAWIFGSGFPKSRSMREIGRPELGTALKPAMELVCMARKPFPGTVAANVLTHGTGAINVDACRIATDDNLTAGGAKGRLPGDNRTGAAAGIFDGAANTYEQHTAGRWPANVILDEAAAEALDAMSGVSTSASKQGVRRTALGMMNDDGWKPKETIATNYGDTGGASRFFYCAKSSRRERNAGLDGMPERTKKQMMRSANGTGDKNFVGGFPDTIESNHHPTVKPLALMRYLIQLVTPPGGIVLDPFMGSGSTLVAAAELGFSAIGIELSEEYAEIAARRVDYALNQRSGYLPGLERSAHD